MYLYTRADIALLYKVFPEQIMYHKWQYRTFNSTTEANHIIITIWKFIDIES